MTQKPLIFILMPSTGYNYDEFVIRTAAPLMGLQLPWCDKAVLSTRAIGIPHARNVLAEAALNQGADYLFWLDNDILVEGTAENPTGDPNVAMKALYDLDVPIAAAMYREKQPGFPLNARIPDPANPGKLLTRLGSAPKVLEADSIGSGFMLVKAEVYRNIKQPYYHCEMPTDDGEDLYFCRKARKAGYATSVMTTIKLGHLGVLRLNSDGTISLPNE